MSQVSYYYAVIYICAVMLRLICCLGVKIDWVQCDGCELWFHLKCVGMSPSQCSDDDEYHCPTCVQAASSPPTKSRHHSKVPCSSSPVSSTHKKKASKRPDSVDPVPSSKSKSSAAKTVVTSALPVFGTAKQTVAVVTSAVSSKDSLSLSVDSSPPRTVAAGGFEAFARPGGSTKLCEFSTLAQSAARRSTTTTVSTGSTSGSKDDSNSKGKSLSTTTAGSSFTFGQYLYTPWLAKNALAPR